MPSKAFAFATNSMPAMRMTDHNSSTVLKRNSPRKYSTWGRRGLQLTFSSKIDPNYGGMTSVGDRSHPFQSSSTHTYQSPWSSLSLLSLPCMTPVGKIMRYHRWDLCCMKDVARHREGGAVAPLPHSSLLLSSLGMIYVEKLISIVLGLKSPTVLIAWE